MIRLILIFLVQFPMVSQAQWDEILTTESLEAFLEVEKSLGQLDKEKSVCLQELDLTLFPKHCFQYLWLRLEFPMSNGQWKKLQKLASAQCLKTTDQLRNPDEIVPLLQQKVANAACLATLQARQQDLIYINQPKIGPNFEHVRSYEESASTESLL